MSTRLKHLADRYRIEDGVRFRLKDHDPGDTWTLRKSEAQELLARSREALGEMQGKLYAQDNWALLLIFQAMDAAGKDSTIKHVMSGVSPQGCEIHSFKQPSSEELDHDYLWRCSRRLPERGRIGIFNRSYYEEVLIVRVHQDILGKQKLPRKLITKDIWKERYEDIAAYERYLGRNGVVIRKFFLNVSKEEQKKRFLDRLNEPDKNWKFSIGDLEQRNYWNEHMRAYEEMIRRTSTASAPWFVVPADHKWFTRLVVASAVIDTLQSLDLNYPKLNQEAQRGLAAAKRRLLSEK